MQRLPSVGTIVHYVSHGSADGRYPKTCRAAIVTHVSDQDLNLIQVAVFNPAGIHFNTCPYDSYEHPEPGTWHWPEPV